MQATGSLESQGAVPQVYPVEQQLKSPWSSFHPGYMYIVWLKKCASLAPCICSILQAPWLQEADCPSAVQPSRCMSPSESFAGLEGVVPLKLLPTLLYQCLNECLHAPLSAMQIKLLQAAPQRPRAVSHALHCLKKAVRRSGCCAVRACRQHSTCKDMWPRLTRWSQKPKNGWGASLQQKVMDLAPRPELCVQLELRKHCMRALYRL